MKTALILSPPVTGTIISVEGKLEVQKADLLKQCREIATVEDEIAQELAVDGIKAIKGMLSTVESSRVAIKAPVLDLGRQIDGAAKKFCTELEAELTRLNRAVTAFQVAERKRAEEAERKRQQELLRLEAMRLEAERQERMKREEAERAEAAKRQAEEQAFLAESRKAEAAANKAAEAEAQRKVEAEAAAQAERKRLSELAAKQLEVRQAAMVAPSTSKGLNVKTEWTFEVTDLWELAKDNRDLVRLEPNVSAIKAAIAGGMRRCPGLRIYEQVKAEVRR